MKKGSDFCPLTHLFNGCEFPKVHRRDDHCIPAVLYMVQDQILCVGFQTDTHAILVIIGPADSTHIHVYSRLCIGHCQGIPQPKFSTAPAVASNALELRVYPKSRGRVSC